MAGPHQASSSTVAETVAATPSPIAAPSDQPVTDPVLAWSTLIAAVVAAVVAALGAYLQRKTGRESAAAAEHGADAAQQSADAAERAAEEQDRRAKREEVMRTMRWAAELAVADDAGRSALGVAQLTALYDSPLLDEELLPQVDAALSAVVRTPAERIDEIEGDGGRVEVVQAPGPAAAATLADEPRPDLQ